MTVNFDEQLGLLGSALSIGPWGLWFSRGETIVRVRRELIQNWLGGIESFDTWD